MDRVYEADVEASTPPSAPATPATGYPRQGDPATALNPTEPGAHWYYMITESLRNVLTQNGITPDHTDVTLLHAAIAAQIAAGIAPLQSTIRLHTPNGYGSINTRIRRFATIIENLGTDITYADSPTLGASFTINVNGIYAISTSAQFTNGNTFGISKNSTQLTAGVGAIIDADRLALAQTSSANNVNSVGVSTKLTVGDIIRPHYNGQSAGTSTFGDDFTIARVG